MPALVDIGGLHYSYGSGQQALNGVDLTVAEGEHVVVVGPNGSGKSTLARIIAALENPGEAERVVVCGRELTTAEERRLARRHVGILFQDPESQVVGSTVEEDVAFGLENLGLPAAEIAGRVDEMLAAFALDGLREREPHLLSGGQKQRTALAGVLAVPRHLIVLDEPTAMLDARGRREVLDAMRLLRGQGLTLIAVTQEMDEVPAADRAVALEDGRVVFDGTPSELLADEALVRRLSLGVPTAAEVALELRSHGVSLPGLPFVAEDLTAALKAGSAGECREEPVATETSGPTSEEAESVPVQPPAQAARRARDATPRGLSLRCDGVSFGYSDGASQVPAVADVTFELPAGSSTALLGPSGAGKSTLLSLLRGLLNPDRGAIVIDGVAPGSPEYAGRQRRVGVVFQRPEVQLFASTIHDDVAFGPRQMGWPEADVEAAVSESLRAVGLPLERFGDRHPYSLSGGEQRRVALAGVLAMRPGVLLLDEPFVSLDPKGRRELGGVLQALRADGVTLVVTTHDVDQAWALCDTRLLLRDGRLLADGPWSFDAAGREALAAAGLSLPTLVDIWQRLGLPPQDAPRTAAEAAAALARSGAWRRGGVELAAPTPGPDGAA